MLSKIITRYHFEINYIYIFYRKVELAISCKLSPEKTLYMKCQILFSGKYKEYIISLSSVMFAHRVVEFKAPFQTDADDIFKKKCYLNLRQIRIGVWCEPYYMKCQPLFSAKLKIQIYHKVTYNNPNNAFRVNSALNNGMLTKDIWIVPLIKILLFVRSPPFKVFVFYYCYRSFDVRTHKWWLIDMNSILKDGTYSDILWCSILTTTGWTIYHDFCCCKK